MIRRNLKLIGVQLFNVGGSDHWSFIMALNVSCKETPRNESALEIPDHRILHIKMKINPEFIAGWTSDYKDCLYYLINDREFCITTQHVFWQRENIPLETNSIPFIWSWVFNLLQHSLYHIIDRHPHHTVLHSLTTVYSYHSYCRSKEHYIPIAV